MRDFHMPGRSTVISANGMCATSHPLASQVAIDILKSGGNAMDAAIAAAVLLGICEPAMTGIGGDCFVLFKPADSQKLVALNGSGRAPAALSAALLRDRGHKNMPVYDANAVTVPGAVDAFCRLSEDWGKLGLDAVLQPAISYSQAGIPVAPRVAFDWQTNADTLTDDARKFYLNDGQIPKVGQLFRHREQADILRMISQKGRAGFYEGDVAEDMVASLRARGGCHTLDDFAATRCEYTEPVFGQYKDCELWEHPPNGQGLTAILLSKILSHFDLPSLEPFGTQRAHIEAEAAKLAYDARDRFIADADYMTRHDAMLSDETAAKLAALIDPKRAMSDARKESGMVHKDTVYLTVVDKDRMVVSMIYSIFKSFGSGIASQKYGVLFQNRGAGFTLEEGHPNEAGGNKRPLHTIIPGMLKLQGNVLMPFGVMGGAFQPNGHARFLTNIVDYGMDPQTAIDGPRSFSDQGIMKVERGYSDKVRQDLGDMGHQVVIPTKPIGGAQAILIDDTNGTLHGASDPRKDGLALGY